MNFLYIYYSEIKNRLSLICVSWICASLVTYFYKEIVLFSLVSYNNVTVLTESQPYFIFTNITEIFSVYTRLVFFIANQILVINVMYHFLMFLSLGLYKREYINLNSFFKLFFVTWSISLVLLNKVILPATWSFFLSFQEQGNSKAIAFFFEAKLNEYLEYYISLYYLCLLNSQFFVIVILSISYLSKNINNVYKSRKIFYYIFVLFSTVTTPPDVLSQLLVSCSLILLYETFLFVKIIKTLIRQPIKTGKNSYSKH
jgi:Sec-independent protein secretion pathway component TatC